MRDILPQDWFYFNKILQASAEMAEFYGFGRIETPILENLDIFNRGVGINTDIVGKQMYVLKSGGEFLALRPEYTAGVVRAFIEEGMSFSPKPIKFWYFGPCFRREKPQAGRFREFWQVGFEVLGESYPVIDAQIIQVIFNILKKLKIKNLVLQINSIGDSRCRGRYKGVLTKYLRSCRASLCADCRKRIRTNPFRVLDCKKEKCRKVTSQAPQMLDFLCKECHSHFREVLEFLDELSVPYRLNPYLVRGLDYYTKTVFEIFSEGNDKNAEPQALAGGGRYDGLIKLLGGPETPAAGVAMGVERIAALMKERIGQEEKKPMVFLVQLGSLAKRKSMLLLEEFRRAKLPVAENLARNSFKSQLSRANKLGVKYALILGQKEALEGTIILRDMDKGAQKILKMEKAVETIRKKIKK
jgi:histidyl-tRNA synthetase